MKILKNLIEQFHKIIKKRGLTDKVSSLFLLCHIFCIKIF